MVKDYSPRDLLLFCYSKLEVDQARAYAQKEQDKGNFEGLLNHYFFSTSADCLRYIEALEKVGVHANNIELIPDMIERNTVKQVRHVDKFKSFCPNCDDVRVNSSMLFCWNCGQRLKWKD